MQRNGTRVRREQYARGANNEERWIQMKDRLWARRYQVLSALLLILVLAETAVLVGALRDASMSASPASPPDIPLPPQSTLVRTEDVLTDQLQVWYYTVQHSSENAVLAFYHSRLPQEGWRCFASMATTSVEQNGQPITGSGQYITAKREHTELQINSGSMAFGETILGSQLEPMLAAGAVALKISLEPAQTTACS
jgi:hypothetical protein